MKKAYIKNSGFTLLEVMVSLAVFAVAAASLSMAGGSSINKMRYLQNKSLAVLVAENHIAALRMDQVWPQAGQNDYPVAMAGRRWTVMQLVNETSSQGMRRIDIEVFGEDEGNAVAMITAFLSEPTAEQRGRS